MKKKAIVVGATSGIGLEVARLLASGGYEVGIAGRREERLRDIMRENEGIVAYRRIDVRSAEAPQQLLDMIRELGGIDLISIVPASVGRTVRLKQTRRLLLWRQTEWDLRVW